MPSLSARSWLPLIASLSLATPATAKTIEVHMKNQGAEGMMVFEPSFVKAVPGDTIRFVPTDKSHNAETIPGMIPAAAAPATGKMNQELVVTLREQGVYGFKCKPHIAMGMVALVQVGKPANLEAAKSVKLPGLAAKRMNTMFQKVK